jgi:hypothetical protein
MGGSKNMGAYTSVMVFTVEIDHTHNVAISIVKTLGVIVIISDSYRIVVHLLVGTVE